MSSKIFGIKNYGTRYNRQKLDLKFSGISAFDFIRWELLLAGIKDPVHFYDEKIARLGALTSMFGWLPEHLRKQVGQSLSDATDDPSYFVKVQAARSLGSVGLSEGVAALESLLTKLPAQDYPLIKKQLQKIRSHGQAAEIKKLQSQIDEMHAKLGKMELRLQEVESED